MRGDVCQKTSSTHSQSAAWRSVRLADVGRWLSGGTPNTSNDVYWGGNIPWISAASLKSFSIERSDRRLTTLGAISGTRLIPEGTVLFVVRGMSLNKEFRVGVTACEVAFGQDCKAIVPDGEIDPIFLANALSAQESRILRMVETTSHGTGRLDTERLGELKIGVPAIAEQLRIVEVLASVDRDIEALERRIAKLRTVEISLARAAFNAIEAKWFSLGDLAQIAAGVTLGSEAVGEGSVELPYLRVANVLDGRIDIADLKTVRILRSQVNRYALKRGDVLLTEGGDLDKLGRGAVWEGQVEQCLHQNHVFRVRCSPALVPDYLSLYTASSEGRRYFLRVGKQSTNLASINSTQVKAMPVPVPSVEEQEHSFGPIRAVRRSIAAIEARAAKLRTIRKAMTEDLLTGRVRVDDL